MKVRANGAAHINLGHRPRLICIAPLALSSAGVMPGIKTVTIADYMAFVLRPLTSVLRPLTSVLRHLTSVLRPLTSVICHLTSVLRPLSSVFCPPSSVLYHLSSVLVILEEHAQIRQFGRVSVQAFGTCRQRQHLQPGQ